MSKNTYMTAAIMSSLSFLNKSELTKHFFLKTSDRAPNKEHCRSVCDTAITAYNKDKAGFVQLAKELSYDSLNRFMMAATGRPYKDRKSGKNSGGQFQADEIANCCLTELAYFLAMDRPDVKYANCAVGLEAKLKIRSKTVKPAPRTRTRRKTVAKKTG